MKNMTSQDLDLVDSGSQPAGSPANPPANPLADPAIVEPAVPPVPEPVQESSPLQAEEEQLTKTCPGRLWKSHGLYDQSILL